MSDEEKIIEYLLIKSKGLLRLNINAAREIIKIIIPSDASVRFCKYNFQTKDYDMQRIIYTTDLIVYDAVYKYLQIPPTIQFYRYDCFNSNSEFQSFIYSAKSNIF